MNEVILIVEDAFQIYGKGTAVTGKILPDKVKIGSTIRIEDADGCVVQDSYTRTKMVPVRPESKYALIRLLDWFLGGTTKYVKKDEGPHPLRIMAIETFNKSHEEATKGQDVALLFWGVKSKPEKGMRIVRGD
jgi:hypothetical protein